MKEIILIILIVLFSTFSYADDKERLKKMFNEAPTFSSWLYAVKGLTELKDKTIIPKVIDKINELKDSKKEEDIDVVEELLGVIAEFKDKSNINFILELMNNNNLRIKRMCVYVIGEIGDLSNVKDIIDFIHDETNYTLRREMIYALGKLGAKELYPILIKLYPDEDPSVRGNIVLSMYNFKKMNLISHLEEELKYEQNTWVKEKLEFIINKLK